MQETAAIIHPDYQPKILGFFCHWCCYAGADAAGVSRFQYPPHIRVVRIMCTARVDAAFIMEAFLQGVDGVLVGGWHLGECHYQSGNVEAVHTIDAASRLLSHAGINPRRLSLEWVSAAEAPRFVSIVTGFSETIKSLGPLGAGEGISSDDLAFRLKAAKGVTQREKFRWILGKKTEFAREGNVYGEVFSQHELGRLLDGLITEDFQVHQMLQLLEEKPLTVKEIAGRLGLQPAPVLMHLTALRRRKLVEVKEIKEGSPHYGPCPESDRKQHGC